MSTRHMGAVALLVSAIALAASSGYAAAANTDAATAKALNVTRADLPVSVKWTASAQAPNSASETALAVKAVGCIRAGGGAAARISTDPFGTTEVVSGTVTADAESPYFAPTGSRNSVASVSSEVVMLKSASQAANDLSAFATNVAHTCLTNLFIALLGKEAGEGKFKFTMTAPSIPHLGTGRGGLDLRIVLSGGKLPGPIIDYTYFYVQGRAEVALSFVSFQTQFPVAWANAIAARVMDKARALLD